MNHPAPTPEDPLDTLLRAEGDYVADDGFTRRVVAALPPRRRRSWLRPAILGFAMLGALALGLWLVPAPLEVLRHAYDHWPEQGWAVLRPLLPLLLALAPAFWLGFSLLEDEA